MCKNKYIFFIYRLSPVIVGMQENTKKLINKKDTKTGDKINEKITQENWSNMKPTERMYAYMPNNEELIKQKNYCENVLPPCIIQN